jgi:hypothetical protein
MAIGLCVSINDMKVSEDRALRRIFGPKNEEVEGGWRRLHNEEPSTAPYPDPDTSTPYIPTLFP